ncbi:unnamed protein product, partial [Didymodactylos carnosus]
FHLKDSTSWNDNTTLPLHYNESRMWKREADRIDMRVFRYGGVKVTYFLPRSVQPVTLLKSSTVDYSTNRLSLPSFEKKALADSVQLFMRALRLLNEKGANISFDNKSDHLKIRCRSPYKAVEKHRMGELLVDIMKSTTFEGFSGHIEFNKYGERINYILDVHQITMNKLPKNVGNFTNDLFLMDDTEVFQGRQTHDFDKGREWIITTILDEPFTMINYTAAGNLRGSTVAGQILPFDHLYGYCVDLARFICEMVLKIRCKFRIVKDGRFGQKLTDGLWNGMIAELMRHDLWMCVILAYIGVSVILFVVSRFSPYERIEDDTAETATPQLSNKFSILNIFFFALTASMLSLYTANLAAFLVSGYLNDEDVTPIKSVEDLARQTHIQYGVVRGGSTQAFFEKSDVKIFRQMYTKSAGEYAFLLESTKNEYANERFPCDTMKVSSDLDSKGYGIATPVGSELREAINIVISEMSEAGILNALKNRWFYEKSECSSGTIKNARRSHAMNSGHVRGIFYFLIGGLALAIIIAFLEYFFVKCRS